MKLDPEPNKSNDEDRANMRLVEVGHSDLVETEIDDEDPAVKNGNHSFWKSLKIAGWGFRQAVYDRNFKIMIAVAGFALILAGILRLDATKWAILILCITWVLSLELINTALEKNVDLASNKHYHPLAKDAKDIAAGGVLLASLAAVIIGLLILGPPLWQLIFGR